MFIKQIEVRNFKSFRHLKIDLGELNVFVGANASGKSNFIRILKFLRNIIRYNLNDAISIEGGVEYLRNINIGNAENLFLSVTYNPLSRIARETDMGLLGIILAEANYQFEIRFHRRGKGFNIVHDSLSIHYDFVKLKQASPEEFEEVEQLGSGQASCSIVNNKLRLHYDLPEFVSLEQMDTLALVNYGLSRNNKLPPKTLFIETPFFGLAHNWILDNPLEDIGIYDFAPKLSQQATSVTGKAELEEDGSNLSIVLKHIMSNTEKKRQFLNLMSDLLPFVNDLHVKKQTDKSFLFALQEKYSTSTYLPAFLLSDGTVNIIAAIVSLYFEQKPLIILEEPERNIHPGLIQQVVNILEEVASDKQIVVTTHNPEFVKHTRFEDLILISRDQDGFSEANRPAEREDVNMFLQNEIGIEELFVDNLLGV